MEFNRTIVLGGHNVTVREVDKSGSLAEDRFLGTWQMSSNCIDVARDMPPSRKVEVLLHEISHAIIHTASLSREQDEVVVSLLGEGLTAFLRQNPELVLDMLQTLTNQEIEAHGTGAEPAQPRRRKPARKRSGKTRRAS